MDFLIQNHVEFERDPVDNDYVATIKIVNKQDQPSIPAFANSSYNPADYREGTPDIINGRDQMKLL